MSLQCVLRYVVGVCPNKMATQAVTSLEITTFYTRYEVITEMIKKNIIFCHVMHFSPKEIN
jgi:hypothetical protein